MRPRSSKLVQRPDAKGVGGQRSGCAPDPGDRVLLCRAFLHQLGAQAQHHVEFRCYFKSVGAPDGAAPGRPRRGACRRAPDGFPVGRRALIACDASLVTHGLPELRVGDLHWSCRRAQTFLQTAHGTTSRLFESAEGEAHPLHAEDLRRSALVFACAGMDRVCKALIEDALPELTKLSSTAEDDLAKWAERHLAPGGVLHPAALSKVLMSPYIPRDALLMSLVEELTGDSLQSVEQLFRIGNFMRVPAETIRTRRAALTETFQVRNLIVHEMDLAREGTTGERNRREPEIYLGLAGYALDVADALTCATSQVIVATRDADPFWSKRSDDPPSRE